MLTCPFCQTIHYKPDYYSTIPTIFYYDFICTVCQADNGFQTNGDLWQGSIILADTKFRVYQNQIYFIHNNQIIKMPIPIFTAQNYLEKLSNLKLLLIFA